MPVILKGKTHKYGANVNTDEIIPARYLNSSDPAVLAAHCMEDIDLDFVKNVRPGDVIVAGANFGCGSSREHAPIALKACGVSAVIAESFARIFFRNSVNIGLPILECPEAAQALAAGEQVEINLNDGIIAVPSKNASYSAKPFPDFMRAIIQAGGLIEYAKSRINK